MKEVSHKLYESFFYLCGKLGCHQMPNRSFYIKGYQLPLCARCTGVVLGYFIELIFKIFLSQPIWMAVLLLLPMGIDWGVQTALKKNSNNNRRFLVGILGGIGIIVFLENYLFYIN